MLILIYAAGAVPPRSAAGCWSDRTGRRKPLVIVSSLVMAAGAVLLAVWPTWTARWSRPRCSASATASTWRSTRRWSPRCCRPRPTAARTSASSTSPTRPRRCWRRRWPRRWWPGSAATRSLYALTAVVTLAGAVLVLPIRSVR